MNNKRGDRMNNENRSMRYAAYKIFTWWVHNRLGKDVWKPAPSCAVWPIRDSYPEVNIIYTPFQEARDEISASLL